MKLVIGTYNICHCMDFNYPVMNDYKSTVDIEKVAKIISENELEIIGLNEVYDFGPKPEYCEQASKLAKLTKLNNYVYGLGKEFEWKDKIGNAIISKYKIKSKEFYPVKQPEITDANKEESKYYEDRIIVKAVIEINGKDIAYISTHFGLTETEQDNIVKVLCEVIDACDLPIILCGDFNALPHSKQLMPIYERLLSVADVVDKTDLFTWASYSPERTIDYIFVSKDIKVIEFDVDKRIMSDHRLVKAKIKI